MVTSDIWEDENLDIIENNLYNIGMSDGEKFKRVISVGEKTLNNKTWLCFKTHEALPISLNPSFIVSIVEAVKTTE